MMSKPKVQDKEKVSRHDNATGTEKSVGAEKSEKGLKRKMDFFSELIGKRVQITTTLNTLLIDGEIIDDSVYQIKVKDTDGNVLYINKAFIAIIEPVVDKKKK